MRWLTNKIMRLLRKILFEFLRKKNNEFQNFSLCPIVPKNFS